MRPSSGVKLTYDDFLLFPDDGQRHELILSRSSQNENCRSTPSSDPDRTSRTDAEPARTYRTDALSELAPSTVYVKNPIIISSHV